MRGETWGWWGNWGRCSHSNQKTSCYKLQQLFDNPPRGRSVWLEQVEGTFKAFQDTLQRFDSNNNLCYNSLMSHSTPYLDTHMFIVWFWPLGWMRGKPFLWSLFEYLNIEKCLHVYPIFRHAWQIFSVQALSVSECKMDTQQCESCWNANWVAGGVKLAGRMFVDRLNGWKGMDKYKTNMDVIYCK